jgi:hexosaminidase
MMIRILLFLSVVLQVACSNPPRQVAIIPKPVSLELSEGNLPMRNGFTLSCPEGAQGDQLKALLTESITKRNFNIVPEGGTPVVLSIINSDTLAPSGHYELTVNQAGVTIMAPSPDGLFYGMQSFIQLLPQTAEVSTIPYLAISDHPRFPYRGLHLDVSRHFFPVSFVKQYIDWLAFHKFNYFHWHLTDDQGWRIEIKKFPELQRIASQRKETLIGHGGNPKDYDGTPYGGYYTQDEIREVVQYAAERYVTILPEIEMPGHALAALAAYPSLGCTGGPYEVGTKWGVFKEVFCAGKDETFTFLQEVLDEVIPLFPGPYVHVGGDECPKDSWKLCKNCQRRIKAEKLKDENELQSYFIRRMETYLNSKGKRLIGWNEILEGGLAPNATVMSWQGEAGGIAAAKEQHDVIMTPGGWVYFDQYQDTTGQEPLAIGGFISVSKVYAYEPVPPVLDADEARHILGAQANLWTEYVATPEHAAYMVWPRACALAEVLWSPKEGRTYDDFLVRLQPHLGRLQQMGIPFAPHVQKEFKNLNP